LVQAFLTQSRKVYATALISVCASAENFAPLREMIVDFAGRYSTNL
jgi:hypothetical protein